MKQKQVEKKMEDLFSQHKLSDWKFGWLKKRNPFRSAGNCNYQTKTIKLQPNFVEWNSDESVVNTMLHEIAHALRPRHGHNKFWKRTAQEIGCVGHRCYSKEVINKK